MFSCLSSQSLHKMILRPHLELSQKLFSLLVSSYLTPSDWRCTLATSLEILRYAGHLNFTLCQYQSLPFADQVSTLYQFTIIEAYRSNYSEKSMRPYWFLCFPFNRHQEQWPFKVSTPLLLIGYKYIFPRSW